MALCPGGIVFRHASIQAAALALVATAFSLAPTDVAADVQTFLNAPAWKLEYQVSFKGACEYTTESFAGTYQNRATIEGGFSAMLLLDLRNVGPGAITMFKLATAPDGSSLPPEEAQKRVMDVIMRSETLANWTTGGAMINAVTEEETQAAVAANIEAANCTGYLNYTLVTRGTGLVDEGNMEYSLASHTSIHDTGTVQGSTNLTLDIDSQTKHYAFPLAHEFGDQTTQSKRVKVDTVTYKGEAPTVERTETEVKLVFPGGITIDEPNVLMGKTLLLEGTFDPALGNITGERTLKAHSMDGQTPAPGELKVRFTLTPQP